MLATIRKSIASGEIKAPPSKSQSHRFLIAAGLADGVSRISGVEQNDDVSATVGVLKALGAVTDTYGDTVVISGCGGRSFFSSDRVNCRASGSTLRFFIPIAMTGTAPVTFEGGRRLLSRPMDIYSEIAREQNLLFENNGRRLTVCGKLKSGEYAVRGDISSQFITGLIFALPLLSGDSVIKLIPPVESRPYINMTLDAVSRFGIRYAADNDVIYVPGGQAYMPFDAAVEGDFSNAAFLEAFNLTGGSVIVKGLSENSLQGDKIYKELFQKLMNNRDGKFTADISQCPDLGPILIAAMAVCGGGSLTGTHRLRIKESDRTEAMRTELRKFGVGLTFGENDITVPNCAFHAPTEPIDPHGDHRIAMSLAFLCAAVGGTIKNCETVSKSYPGFWEDIRSLGVDLELSAG